jgi:hypothetical protein
MLRRLPILKIEKVKRAVGFFPLAKFGRALHPAKIDDAPSVTLTFARAVVRQHGYAIEVKLKDKLGRLDIDAFETAMRRSKREKGFFVAFDYSNDAMRELDRYFKADHAVIIPLTVKEVLDEQIARKLA